MRVRLRETPERSLTPKILSIKKLATKITVMITHDDNGYGRVKRWRDAHRGLYNMRQRDYRRRKKDLSGGVESRHAPEVASPYVPEAKRALGSQDSGSSAPPAQKSKVAELRELMARASKAEPDREVAARPVILRDDFGRVITEQQWNILEKRKVEAKAGGYVLDEYTQ